MNGLAHLEVEELAEVMVLGRNRSTGVDRRSTGVVRISSGCHWSCNGRPVVSIGRPVMEQKAWEATGVASVDRRGRAVDRWVQNLSLSFVK